MTGIYKEIGGDQTINKLVNSFYNKISKDKRVNHLLKDIDLDAQKSLTLIFLKSLMGEKPRFATKQQSNYLNSQKLTEQELIIFEETWHNVLSNLNLQILLPLLHQGMTISRFSKNVGVRIN